LLDIAKSLDQINKPELAHTTWQRAANIVKRKENASHAISVFQVSLSFENLDVAERFKEGAEGNQDRFQDLLDLEIFKRTLKNSGDRTRIAKVPRQKLDFWVATEIGRAYAAAGDFAGAEKFIAELNVPHEENDPRTIGKWVYEDLPKKLRSDGDIDRAKVYVDKAMETGGDLYYSGFSTKVLRSSIYGDLKTEFETLVQYAANHRGHQRRELVQSLIAELIRENLLDETVQCANYLEDRKDINRVLMRVAIAYEKKGKHALAVATADKIDSVSVKAATKIGMASQLWNQKDFDLAQSVFNSNHELPQTADSYQANRDVIQNLTLAYLTMKKKVQFERLFSTAKTAEQQAMIVSFSLRNLVEISGNR